MKKTFTLSVCFVLLSCTMFGQASYDGFISRSHTYMGTTLPYRLFIPTGYSSAKKYPIVLCLHGSGESGTDNLRQLTYPMATSWADPTNQAKYPCFVVAPQYPDGGTWSLGVSLPIRPELAAANNILDSLAREFAVDTNRYYVTGLSDGGFGTWDLIIRFPGRFAAAVPVSGGGDPGYAINCVGVPVWDFHGAIDAIVPVQYSRNMINALHTIGRPVVYTHCRNLDCTGLPDSTIAMYVQSHADLFYTEFQNGDHTGLTWNQAYNYAYLFPWVFDKYKKQPGAITLSNLKSHRTLKGIEPITWTSTTVGDSVEIWFSPDLGDTWGLISRSEPNTGSYNWNTAHVGDCSFGQIAVYLKNAEHHIYGVTRSGSFSISNSTTGMPFVKVLDDDFTNGIPFMSDSLEISLFLGDSKGSTLSVAAMYSADGGETFVQADAYVAHSDTIVQVRKIGITSLANSDRAILKMVASNGSNTASAQTCSFVKRTTRNKGLTAAHIAGSGGTTVSVSVIDPAALTGHRYRVTFNDTTSSAKSYDVLDGNLGVKVIRGATELDGTTEGPLFDGLRLRVKDLQRAIINQDSTRWLDSHTTLHTNVAVVERFVDPVTVIGYPDPYDYRITLTGSVVDTSKAAFGISASPMKFIVWNLTKNRKADVLFDDPDVNQTISSFDEVEMLEPDSTGSPRLSWGVFFVASPGDTLPVPGSVFQVKTLKPATAADIFEFTATATSVTHATTSLQYGLSQNYPNPFNPSTTIRYELPYKSTVQLTVFNTLGQQVATLVQGDQETGYHEVRFNASGLSSGVYFYRMQAGNYIQTRKLIFLK
ncbi:MAG: peptidase [Bacteroidetes bacterium]|nr:peptidase [Bacteroidota bacterium]